jgi:hypothetical protein
MQGVAHNNSSESGFLTFEEICPAWSNKLKNELTNDEIQILVRKPEQCIVGEAWGYSTRYLGYRVVYLIPFVGCWECIKYGNKIGKTAKQHSNSCKNYLEPILDDLVRHWNEKHSEITLKKRREKKMEMTVPAKVRQQDLIDID